MWRCSVRSRLGSLAIAASALAGLSTPASAQQIAVQQPVFRQFSAGTTVSVPDRGRAFIGGVSRAASGRITTGPFRSPSSTGLETENSSISAHVWIHDFEEMDRAALEAADRSSMVQRDRSPPLTGMSGHAWRTMSSRTPERSQIDFVRVPSRMAKSPYRSGLRR